MSTPLTASSKTSLHPLMTGALIAIILVCGLSAAALMGWLPSSTGRSADTVPANNGLPAASITAQADAAPAVPAPVPAAAPAPAPAVKQAPPQLARNTQPAPKAAAPARVVCHDCGVIDAVTPVETRGEGTAVGTAGGAIIGGLLGNQVGSGNGRKLATVAGAIGGAMAGNQIEGNMKTTRSYNIVVRLNDGTTRTFHQAEQPAWREGDRVRIVNGSIRSNS